MWFPVIKTGAFVIGLLCAAWVFARARAEQSIEDCGCCACFRSACCVNCALYSLVLFELNCVLHPLRVNSVFLLLQAVGRIVCICGSASRMI